ncbi:hypothetical protein BpHYR1_016706 [Brachionus plicatilis]|uniref:Uncharacterized protein n=1 Tax=Brachionus plicatilis TaxID=10195 RepID=A0A3M7QPW7_BRAPC|nr:hypothetical protein BpHYR1_016706 [Brachionus plicatilis]
MEGFLNKFELTDSNSSNLSCVESDKQITTKKNTTPETTPESNSIQLQGKKITKSGRKYRDNLDEIVTIGPSVSVDTLGLQNDKRVLLLVLINKEFDFSCKIKEDMLLTMPEDVPYGALNVDFIAHGAAITSVTTTTIELWLILLASLIGVFFLGFSIASIFVCFYLYKEYAKKARLDRKSQGYGFTIMKGRKSLTLGADDEDAIYAKDIKELSQSQISYNQRDD